MFANHLPILANFYLDNFRCGRKTIFLSVRVLYLYECVHIKKIRIINKNNKDNNTHMVISIITLVWSSFTKLCSNFCHNIFSALYVYPRTTESYANFRRLLPYVYSLCTRFVRKVSVLTSRKENKLLEINSNLSPLKYPPLEAIIFFQRCFLKHFWNSIFGIACSCLVAFCFISFSNIFPFNFGSSQKSHETVSGLYRGRRTYVTPCLVKKFRTR